MAKELRVFRKERTRLNYKKKKQSKKKSNFDKFAKEVQQRKTKKTSSGRPGCSLDVGWMLNCYKSSVLLL